MKKVKEMKMTITIIKKLSRKRIIIRQIRRENGNDKNEARHRKKIRVINQ